ncbi:MAG: DUF805 domain-containing protein [Gammaproteobacteria bacterium]|nr:DUF805 domain-containing protein [Gammaproteobacteria bacterium]
MATVNPYATPEASLELGLKRSKSDEYDETPIWSPKGRFGRAAFIHYSMVFGILIMVVYMILFIGIGGGIAALGADDGQAFAAAGPVIFILNLLVLPVTFILLIRRLHDLNWSGWMSLLIFIPLVNLVIYVPALFFRGVDGVNDYGPPRRYVGYHAIAVWLVALVPALGIALAILIPLLNSGATQ